MDSLAPSQRHCYTHENRTIYEWDQTLAEVNIYIEVPSGVRAKQLFVEVKQSHIKIGITPNPPYLDVRQPFMPLMCALRPAIFTQKSVSIHLSGLLSIALSIALGFVHLQKDLTEGIKTDESFWTLGEHR